MHVRVVFRPARQAARVVEVQGATVAHLLEAVGQSGDSTLVVRGANPITEQDDLVEGEELLLLSAFSGG